MNPFCLEGAGGEGGYSSQAALQYNRYKYGSLAAFFFLLRFVFEKVGTEVSICRL
jgi:hypothetical protein